MDTIRHEEDIEKEQVKPVPFPKKSVATHDIKIHSVDLNKVREDKEEKNAT